MTEKRLVQFDKVCSPYLSGEVASFVPIAAAKLVSKGIAHYVAKGDSGWVPVNEKGEPIDGNFEQNDEDESEQEGTEEGSGGEPEEEGEGEGQEAEAASKPTKAKRGRRKRAKL